MSIIRLTEVSNILALPVFLINDFVSFEFNGRKLPQVREYAFDVEQVNEFRVHLDSSWPENQREPPEYIKRYIIYESGNACALCRQQRPSYEFAHIKPWARFHSHNPHNLIYLCLDCHKTRGNDQKLLRCVKEELVRKISLFTLDIIYDCDSDLSPGDAVYTKNYRAHKALATEDPTQLATGLVRSKLGPDRCLVQRIGIVTGMNDLIPGEEYFLSQDNPGLIVRRTQLTPRNGILQLLGRAESDSAFVLSFYSYVKYTDLNVKK